MAIISKTYTFSAGSTIIASEHNTNFDTLYDAFNGNIENVNVKSTAAIAGSKISPVFTSATRVEANLSVSGSFAVTSGVSLSSAGARISIKTGANSTMGTAMLQGGTAVVSNTTITTASHIFLTNMTVGGTAGSLYISNVTNGAFFQINSTITTATAKVSWLIVEPV